MPSHALFACDLHVSFSQLSTYLQCPERFRQRYLLDALPSHRASELVFGNAIHAALAVHHEHLMREGVPLELGRLTDEFDDILAIAQQGDVPILWDDDEAPDVAREKGHALLALYHRDVRPHRVLHVEVPFQFEFHRAGEGEETLAGIVDLIEEDSEGRIWITELKTAQRRYGQDRLLYDHQMSIYAAAREALGVPNAGLRYRLLLKGKEPRIEDIVIVRDGGQLDETRHVLRQVLRAIDQRIFYPVRGWGCAKCPYRASCGESPCRSG
jgi:putative RecB family exonuclease